MSEANGSAPQGVGVIEQLRLAIDERRRVLSAIEAQRAEVAAELRRYEKALALLEGGPESAPRSAPAPTTVRRRPSRISEERMAEFERMVCEYAAEHDEFRQVDFRAHCGTLPDGMVVSSSAATQVFRTLRERNVIRLARVDGVSKYYRLTRKALKASA